VGVGASTILTSPRVFDATLSEVFGHCAAAGRPLHDGPNAGVGGAPPHEGAFEQ
jgi:hypothetical protein